MDSRPKSIACLNLRRHARAASTILPNVTNCPAKMGASHHFQEIGRLVVLDCLEGLRGAALRSAVFTMAVALSISAMRAVLRLYGFDEGGLYARPAAPRP